MQKQPTHKNCFKHSLPLKYFCQDCQRVICSDCGMIDDEHKTHRLTSKPSLQNTLSKQKLKQFLQIIEERIACSITQQHHYQLQQQIVKSELQWSKNKLLEHYQQMLSKIENEALTVIQQITKDILQKRQTISKCTVLKNFIIEALETQGLPEADIIAKISPNNYILQQLPNEEIYQRLNTQINSLQQEQDFNFIRKSLTALNQIYPEYSNHPFQFNYRSLKHLPVAYSNTISIFGYEWRLKIYPQGTSDNPEYLSLFLQLLNAPSTHTQRYHYRLQLISLNSVGKTISREYCSLFSTGECWGYHDFLALSQLEDYLTEGKLIFVMGIKNVNYYQYCQNMKRYIRKLQGQNQVLEELMTISNHSPADLSSSNIIDDVQDNI